MARVLITSTQNLAETEHQALVHTIEGNNSLCTKISNSKFQITIFVCLQSTPRSWNITYKMNLSNFQLNKFYLYSLPIIKYKSMHLCYTLQVYKDYNRNMLNYE